MADSEGIKEGVQVTLKMMEMLQGLFGFTFNKAERYTALLGRGFGKGVRFLYHLHKAGKMLEGGEKTFQEIVNNRGSLDMAVSTVEIEDWDSKQGLELREYLDNRGVQYVLLDDITKGDNRGQFMYHASDADRINSLLMEYKKLKFNDAKSMADAYDDLPEEKQQTVNATFERGITELDYKALEIPDNPVWNRIEQLDPEKKSEFSMPANVDKVNFREVTIPETNVKKDLARDIAFIRCGNNGYIVPLDCIQEEINGDIPEKMEVKFRCRIDEQGKYLKFQDGIRSYVSGKELAEDLDRIKTSLWKPKREDTHRRNINKGLPLKPKKEKR